MKKKPAFGKTAFKDKGSVERKMTSGMSKTMHEPKMAKMKKAKKKGNY